MVFVPRPSLMAVLAAATWSFLVTAPVIHAQDTCTLCPSGSTMANPDKPFYGTAENQPATCGGFDDFLALVSPDACAGTLTSAGVLSPFNLQYYCACDGVEAPGVCDMCEGGALIENADEANSILNGYTCNQFNDLIASIEVADQCAQMQPVAAICCQEGGGGGDDGAGMNVTAAPDAADDDAAMVNATMMPEMNATMMPEMNGTMAPTEQQDGDDATAGGGGSCQVCADGSEPTNDAIIPLAGMSCSALQEQNLPETVCLTLKSYLAIGALCGCPGEEAPNNCPLCDGGEVSNSTELYDLADFSLTCQQASLFSSYASETICESGLQPLESACCVDASQSEPTAEPTQAVTPAPTTAIEDVTLEPTVTPAEAGAGDDSGATTGNAMATMIGGALVTVLAMMM